MTQKDYDNISLILSEARGRRTQGRLECLLQLTKELSDYFEADNKSFDPDLFMVACQSPRPDMDRIMTARRKARRAGNPGGWRNHTDQPTAEEWEEMAKAQTEGWSHG